MSGLAALLVGNVKPGVHHWHAAFDVDDVRHAVETAGWRFAHLDAWPLGTTRADTLQALGPALGLPDHYGGNLDALWDCLRDLDGPTVLLWDGWGPLAREDKPGFAKLVRLFRDRAAQGGFDVLLRGEGPETGLPSLD